MAPIGAAALRVLGVFAGVLGFVTFSQENFAPADSTASVIKLTVGLDVAGGIPNAGGDLPDVRLFNEAGEFLGISVNPGTVEAGNTAEIRVEHTNNANTNGQQAAYALFSANDNSICVASVSITWPNGDQYGWLGDWGQACGGTWYFSNVFIKGSDYKPNCLWIDASGDQPQTGFQVHFPDFVSKNENDPVPKRDDINYYCNSGPPFKLYHEPEPRGITYWVLKNVKRSFSAGYTEASPLRTRIHQRRRRQNSTLPATPTTIITPDYPTTTPTILNPSPSPSPNPANSTGTDADADLPEVVRPVSRFADTLITSSAASHSASVLCGSHTSVGPDFANPAERLFCRMSNKTLWPFCDGVKVTDGCFDEGLRQLVIGGKVVWGEGYGRVVNWGE
jgi:hypothetical protein